MLCGLLLPAFFTASCSHGSSIQEYESTGRTAELIPVQNVESKLWGYLSTDGKQAIEPQFSGANYFQDGLALVSDTANQLGYINTKGEYAIPTRYSSASDFHEGLAWVALPDSALMTIDTKGNKVFDFPRAAQASVFVDGYSYYKGENGLWGIVDKKGTDVEMPIECADITPCGGPLVILTDNKDNTKRLARIKNGKVELLIPDIKMNIQSANPLFDVIVVKDDGKYGLVDFDGKMVVNPRYKLIAYDSEGMLIFVNDKNKIGWLNSQGEEVIKAKYSDVNDLFAINGYATVSTNGSKFQIIDREGKTVCGAKYQNVFPTWTPDVFRMQDKESNWGLMKADGTIICDPQFNKLICLREGLFMASSNGESFGVISDTGLYDGNAEYNRPSPGAYLTPEAYSRRFSLESIAAMVDKLKASAKFDTTFGELASDNRITKSNLEANGYDVTLAKYTDASRGVACELHVMLDNPPLAYVNRYSSRTVLNNSAKPNLYTIRVTTDKESKNAATFNYIKQHLGCEAWDYGQDAINKALYFTIHISSDGKCTLEPAIEFMGDMDFMDDTDV